MATHDYNIANQTGADFRADLNNALLAIVSNNSNATSPSTTYAYQLWVDTANNVLKLRNSANSDWITTGISITASNSFTGDITGNSATATALATARTINGVSFDGTANISFNTDSVSEGSSNLYFTNERVDDQVNSLLTAGSGISLTYDDSAGTLTIANTNSADITSVIAGDGLTGGGTSGDVTLTVSVDDSSIEINSDSLRVKASGITNAMLAGSIANSKLANSSVTINSQAIALGGSHTFDSDDIGEGSSNLYFTNARARGSLSIGSEGSASGNGAIAYNSSTGVFTYTPPVISGLTGDTDDLSEGSSNLYYTDARANSAIDARVTNTFINNLSGVVADTATALATARSIALSGDVTASGVNFDGTGDITLSTTIAANSVALGTDTTGNYVATVAGTSNEIEVSGSGSETASITIGLPDDVTIAGNLTVNGTTTTVNSDTLSVTDPLIKLAKANSGADSLDIGFYGLYDTSGSQDLYAGLFRDASDSGKFKLFKDLQTEPTTTVNTSGTGYAVGTLVSNLEGAVTGNAATATALETARAIALSGDVVGTANFDGTAGISISTTIQANSVALGTDTTGNYVGTITGGTGITSTGATSGEGIAHSLSVDAAQTQITSVGTLSALTVTGEITANGGIALGDSDKATFGASDDLEIYHGSDNTFLQNSTGSLIIEQASGAIALRPKTGENGVLIIEDGAVSLYHDNSAKLATTSSGVDVTGTLTSDGLTVTKASGDIATLEGSGTASDVEANLVFNPVYDVNARIVSAREGANLKSMLSLQTGEDNTGTTKERLRITGSGDIVFYNDAGTTQALYWDASAESLGIGTTSPLGKLSIQEGSSGGSANANADGLVIDNNGKTGITILTPNNSEGLIFFADPDDDNIGRITYNHSTNAMGFVTNNSTALTVDSSQRVGIGLTPSASPLEIKSSSASASTSGMLIQANGNTNTIIAMGEKSTDGGRFHIYDGGVEKIAFYSDGTDNHISAGNLGLGNSSPDRKLHITETTGAKIRLERDDTTLASGNTLGIIEFETNDSTDAGVSASFSAVAEDGSGTTGFKFVTGTPTSNSERLRIDGSGNIGLGNSSPSTKLDVVESSAATAATFKVGNNAAQVANVVVSNDADTGLNLGVFGSSAGTAGMISASDAFITTSTTELNVGVNNSSGVIKFGVGSTAAEKMRIDGTGVGIGTTSPSEILHVQGDGADILITDAGGGEMAKLGATGSNNGILELKNSSHSSTVFLNTSGDSYLNGGSVGIGNSSPDATLDAVGSINVAGQFTSTATSKSNNTYTLMIDSSAHTSNLSAAGAMAVDVNSGRALTIDGSGKLGLGTSSPSKSLHILNADPVIRLEDSSPSAYAEIDGAGGDLIISCDGGNDDADSVIQFKVDGSEKMRLDDSGRLGIGTTSSGALLTVNSGNDSLPTIAASTKAIFACDNTANFDTSVSILSASSGGESSIFFGDYANEDAGIITYYNDNGGSDYMSFTTNTSEAMA